MGSGKSEFVVRQLAIGVNDAGQRIGIEQLGTDRIVCRGESLIVAFGDRHAGSHGMSAIALQQSRMERIEQYQSIAQLQPRNTSEERGVGQWWCSTGRFRGRREP